MHKLYTNPTFNPTLRDKESKRGRDKETKSQRDKERKSQREGETKRLRVKETKSQRDGGSILAWKAIP